MAVPMSTRIQAWHRQIAVENLSGSEQILITPSVYGQPNAIDIKDGKFDLIYFETEYGALSLTTNSEITVLTKGTEKTILANELKFGDFVRFKNETACHWTKVDLVRHKPYGGSTYEISTLNGRYVANGIFVGADSTWMLLPRKD